MHTKFERLLSKSLTTLEVMMHYLVVHTGPAQAFLRAATNKQIYASPVHLASSLGGASSPTETAGIEAGCAALCSDAVPLGQRGDGVVSDSLSHRTLAA